MKNKKTSMYVVVPLLIGMSTSSLANALQDDQVQNERAAGTEFFFSDDSEGFQTRKLSAEFLPEKVMWLR